MAKDKSKTGGQEGIRINIKLSQELRYWSQRLGVTPLKLRGLVALHGPYVHKILVALKRPKQAAKKLIVLKKFKKAYSKGTIVHQNPISTKRRIKRPSGGTGSTGPKKQTF